MIAIRGTSRTDCREFARVDESRVVRRNEYTLSGVLSYGVQVRQQRPTSDGSTVRVCAYIWYRESRVLHVGSRVPDHFQHCFSPFSRARERKSENRVEETRFITL